MSSRNDGSRVVNFLSAVRANFLGYKVDPDLLIAYRTAIPSTINLNINHEGDTYIATIKTIENHTLPKETFLITEADSEAQLVDQINDLVLTYKEIPEIYRPYYRQILKPEGSLAKAENLKLVKAA